jgi:predicted outer membrane repeat protein
VRKRRVMIVTSALVAALVSGCGHDADKTAAAPRFVPPPAPSSTGSAPSAPASVTPSKSATPKPSATKKLLPKPGNPAGHATIPADARPVDTSHPTHKIGNGTPSGCTSAAVVKAVAQGGIITFDCGPTPVTITMTSTAKVRNTSSSVVLDGGGRVTLNGGGKHRILYLNTCDKAQTWATSHCDNQATPKLTVQNLAFADGNSIGQKTNDSVGGGGGAIFDRGGRLKVINSRFTGNRCDSTGPDLGGAAIRALEQYQNLPVYVVNSTFTGGVCSNGSGLSSIQVSWTVLNSFFTGNAAIGRGANPARGGTPGGGSGGAIYLDGDNFTLTLDGTRIENNKAKEGGGAIFFVSNDRTGTLKIRNSKLLHNPSAGFETDGLPGIFFLGRSHAESGSTLKK